MRRLVWCPIRRLFLIIKELGTDVRATPPRLHTALQLRLRIKRILKLIVLWNMWERVGGNLVKQTVTVFNNKYYIYSFVVVWKRVWRQPFFNFQVIINSSKFHNQPDNGRQNMKGDVIFHVLAPIIGCQNPEYIFSPKLAENWSKGYMQIYNIIKS